MRISVIVPCRNERAHIGGFLDSVLAQQLDPGQELEVLIADGLSDDGTRELLEERIASSASRILVIDNPRGIVSTGLNAAIQASAGDVIVRMDVHTVYAPDYILQSVRALQETGADNVGGPWVAEGRGVVGQAIAAAFRSPFCNGGGKSHNPHYEGEVDTVYLGCWTREALHKCGLFDTELVRNQDDELNFRLKRCGGRVWQSPRIRSIYTPRGSLRALFRQYLQYGFWKVAVMRKHGSLAAWRQVVPALFVASIVVGLLATMAAALPGVSPAGTSVIAASFGIELAVYALGAVAAAGAFVGSLPWRAVALIPVVTAVYHIAYGMGFLLGLSTLLSRRPQAPPRLFTALTR